MNVCKVIEEAILRDNTHMLKCGDFNYPYIDWENDFVHEKILSLDLLSTWFKVVTFINIFQSQEDIGRDEDGMVYNKNHNPGWVRVTTHA